MDLTRLSFLSLISFQRLPRVGSAHFRGLRVGTPHGYRSGATESASAWPVLYCGCSKMPPTTDRPEFRTSCFLLGILVPTFLDRLYRCLGVAALALLNSDVVPRVLATRLQ